ncbi:MAG: histidinol-phosphate aminotransferase [Saprospiraceae bacterium]|jgi:histidinol-phosphate aminotransferase
MSFDINKIARPSILSLKPYSSARDEFTGQAKVYLDANENPYDTKYNRYPDPFQLGVKTLLSNIKSIPVEQIILGNGSDEIIDLIIRSFCEPAKDEIIILPPTYGMYEVYGNINQVIIKEVPLDDKFDVNSKKVLSQVSKNTKIIFLCSPNNPTGNLLDTNEVKAILQKFDGLVVLDEAYIDFSDIESWSAYLDLYPNLFVMQTLSKAWGLAGIRLGMGFANNNIITLLNKVKPPYNISQLTQEKAFEALQCVDQKDDVVVLILEERVKLQEALTELEAVRYVYPSDANFLLVKINNAAQVYQKLIEKSIVLRDRSNVLLCKDCLRITVGTSDENATLIEALKTL